MKLKGFVLLIIAFISTTFAQSALEFESFLFQKVSQIDSVQLAKRNLEQQESQHQLDSSIFYPKLQLDWKVNRTETRQEFKDTLVAQAEQNIFSGGQEYSNLKSNRLKTQKAQVDLQDAKDLALAKIILLTANYFLSQERLSILEQDKSAALERTKELQKRVRLGQSREPDLLQAQVENFRLDREILENNESLQKTISDFKVLLNIDDIGLSKVKSHTTISNVWHFINKNLNPRSEFLIKSSELEAEILDYDTRTAWRSLLPKLGLYAQQNLRKSDALSNDWELGVKANWVFFEGFKSAAQINSASSARSYAQAKLKNLRLQREENQKRLKREKVLIENKFSNVLQTIDIAKKALQQQIKDYRLGLITSLEVQQTRQSLLALKIEKINLEELRIKHKLSEFLSGELPE